MASPARTNWQNLKKQLTPGDAKLFKKDLGPLLDQVYDAYNAYLAELNKTANGKPACDLPRLKSKIQAALALIGKANVVMTEYRRILTGLPATSSGHKLGPTLLANIAKIQAEHSAEMIKHMPTDADIAKFKLDYMKATLKQM